MNFNDHSNLEGLHAFLSPSQYHWVRYTDEKLIERYSLYNATLRGTEFHDIAKRLIQLGIKLPNSHKTLNMYVNDAIGFKMTPEQPLYFSPNCFGTADSISFNEKKSFLRIHDLKTGITPAKMTQLEVYCALFCLEYEIKPSEIQMETRIYQSDEVMIAEPTVEQVAPIMDKIIAFDKLINELKAEE